MATQFEEQFDVAIPSTGSFAGLRESISPTNPVIAAGGPGRVLFSGGIQSAGFIVGANDPGVSTLQASVNAPAPSTGFEPRAKFFRTGVRLDAEAIYNGVGSTNFFFEARGVEAAQDPLSSEVVWRGTLSFFFIYRPDNPIPFTTGTFQAISLNAASGAVVQNVTVDIADIGPQILAIGPSTTFELVIDLQTNPKAFVNEILAAEINALNFSALPGLQTSSLSMTFTDQPDATSIAYLFGAEDGTPPTPPPPAIPANFWTSFIKTREI